MNQTEYLGGDNPRLKMCKYAVKFLPVSFILAMSLLCGIPHSSRKKEKSNYIGSGTLPTSISEKESPRACLSEAPNY